MGQNELLFHELEMRFANADETARKQQWNSPDDDPYEVLEKNNSIRAGNWIEFFEYAKTHLSDEIQVDWGSFAWKCKGEDLLQMNRDICWSMENTDSIQPDKEYGVVFIEMP